MTKTTFWILQLTIADSEEIIFKGYNWLKDKILSEDGKKKQAKIRELQLIAEKLNCTLAQLSIGKNFRLLIE